MKYVINADDFCGFNNVNQSIVDCFKRGLISQTTVILTCKDWLEDGIKLLKDNDLMSNVGLHVSLSRGYPLTEGIKRTNFFNNGWLVNTILNKKISYFYISRKNKKAIMQEIDAQMKLYKELGFTLMHFDSHGQYHCYPSLYKIFIKTGKKNGFVSIRLPYQPSSKNLISRFFKNKIIKAFKKNFRTVEYGTLNITNCLNYDNKSSFELMVHPINNDFHETKVMEIMVEKMGKPISYKEL